MAVPIILAGLAASAAAATQKWLDERRALLEEIAKEQAWWNQHKARLTATSCPQGQLWIQERDPDVKKFQYDTRYPRVQSIDGPPGGERFWGYCIPNPVEQRRLDDMRVENTLRAIMADRARTDLAFIDRAFSTLVAQGRSPEAAIAEFMNSPAGRGLQPYLNRYAAEGFIVSIDPKTLLARNSEMIAQLRRQMGTTPPDSTPVGAPGSTPNGNLQGAKNIGFVSKLFNTAILTSPFWFPNFVWPLVRERMRK